MTFASLGLSDPILRALKDKGYEKPTSVQTQAIPPILAGRDVMAAAQTGTGKTAGFTLPLLHLLEKGPRVSANCIRALILTPTRELAAQVGESAIEYGKYLPLRTAVVYGGVKINPQMMRLRRGVDVMVATPGRLMDLYQQNAVKFNQVEILVLDEADRMLDMGFIDDIRKILDLLPKKRQNLLFSATFSAEIRALAKGLLRNALELEATPRNTAATTVTQIVYPVDKARKPALLAHLIKENKWSQVLVFARTKRGADRLVTQLEKSRISASAIHGDKSQSLRTKALADFKNNKVKVLVATDIAARGIDINELPQVVNFDLPDQAENYVHRIGRTGRAGSNGAAISLVSADEVEALSDIEHLLGKLLPRKLIDDFEPDHSVPMTQLGTKKKTKPKKPKVKAATTTANAAPAGKGKKKASASKPAAQGNRRPKKKVGSKSAPKKKWPGKSAKS